MRSIYQNIFLVFLIIWTTPASAQNESELDALRSELANIRSEYETRIADLERRLDAAEQKADADTGQQQTPENKTLAQQNESSPRSSYSVEPATNLATSSGSNSFNPDIGVIFQGQAWSYTHDPANYQIPGFPLGGEAGLVAEGFSVGEIEIDISANVDDKFTAWLTAPIVIEDGEAGIEVEEAWIETMTLPAGLSLRMGRYFSNIGYLNDKHSHSWDFVDQPLPYQAFLGGQYIDDGVQLRWLAPTDIYLEVGAEVSRGDRYPAAGAGHSGVGSYAFHTRLGGDVGFSNSWQAGVSYLHTDATNRPSGDPDDPVYFNGDSELWMAEFVWKWAPNGNYRQQNLKLQAEYLWRNEKGLYTLIDGTTPAYDNNQSGWYIQAIFQPIPQWRLGLRYDRLSSDNPGDEFINTPLMPGSNDPRRYSLMTDWSNSEFSRIRLQYTRDEAGLRDDNQWGLQYIFSIGAHGAHSF